MGRVMTARNGPESPIITDARKRAQEEFWTSSRELRDIRQWAQARRTAPMTVLGEVLAEIICRIPSAVQLPALIGGPGTLNLLIASVGYSGAGKGASAGLVSSAIQFRGIMGRKRMPIGSGEGIPHAFGYMHYDKDSGTWGLVRTEESVLIEIREIDTLKAIDGRQGSTLSPTLRQLYSGEQLGFGYADIKKRILIPEHSYRSCVVAGVQPGRGGIILNDTESGFAQRWLWLPAIDRYAPKTAPKEPKQLTWHAPEEIKDAHDMYGGVEYIIDVCKEARDAVEANRLPSLLGEDNGLASHETYTRLKVAAGLAFLEGCVGVEEFDWERAGFIMSVSNGTRNMVARDLREKADEADRARGRSEGLRAAVSQDTILRAAMDRICANVLKLMPGNHGWISGSTLKNKIAQRDRELLAEVLRELVGKKKLESGKVTYRGQTGMQYRVPLR
jgi:hypothetical protein